MAMNIPQELEDQVRAKAAQRGLTVNAYLEYLISNEDSDRELGELASGPLDDSDPDFEEIRQAVREGLDDVDRGDVRPAAEFFAEIFAKHGIRD